MWVFYVCHQFQLLGTPPSCANSKCTLALSPTPVCCLTQLPVRQLSGCQRSSGLGGWRVSGWALGCLWELLPSVVKVSSTDQAVFQAHGSRACMLGILDSHPHTALRLSKHCMQGGLFQSCVLCVGFAAASQRSTCMLYLFPCAWMIACQGHLMCCVFVNVSAHVSLRRPCCSEC